MSRPRLLSIAVSVLIAAVAVAQPQTTAESAGTPGWNSSEVPKGGMPTYIRPETPEQRMARLGTIEDPGTNPDPKKHYWRFGHSYHISRYQRFAAAYDREPGTVRPDVRINIAFELYQHNEEYVWVWVPDPLPPEEAAKKAAERPDPMFNEHTLAYWRRVRPQFFDLSVPPAGKVVRFGESSKGLPVSGSWRNTLAVADMNKDGHPDLIAPPERGGSGTSKPAIFLGNGKGEWRYWSEMEWTHALDYGGVAAADFNKDGHQDLAFAVHLRGVSVFLGNSAGKFTHSSEGLPNDFPTRRVIVTDADRDGYPDLIALSEGPLGITNRTTPERSNLRGFYNRQKGKKWEAFDVAAAGVKIGGDWLTADDLNGDSRPDFVASSVIFGGAEIVYASDGAKTWKPFENDGDLLPLNSTFSANASGKFSSKKRADAIISYTRHWPTTLNGQLVPTPALMIATNIDRLTINDGVLSRTPIMRWGSRRGVTGLANGDFDGDGNEDVLFVRQEPTEAVLLLGDGSGGFTQAKVDGLPVLLNASYDVKVADVNRDKKPDVILMYESTGTTALAERDGSIHVFLNRGAAAAAE